MKTFLIASPPKLQVSRHPRARIPELGELWNPEDDRSDEQIAADEAANDDARTERLIDDREAA